MRTLLDSSGRASLLAALAATVAIVALAAPSARAESDKDAHKAETAKKTEASVRSDAIPSDPQLTTASFGDWIERCQKVGAAATRVCEVGETVMVQGQTQPIAQIAIGRLEKGDPLRMTMVLPVNISLPSVPKVKIAGSPIDLPWRRCLPGGCIADVVLADADLASLRTTTAPGQIEFKMASGQEMKFAISFRGLTQALDALGHEPVAMAESKLR